MKDPWNPTAQEIRQWAFDVNATHEQDWNLAIVGIGHDELLLDLAADPNCPNRDFFLRCLYLLTGDFVRSKRRTSDAVHMNALLDRAERIGDRLTALWAARSRELLSHPERFDYNQWCLGSLAVDSSIEVYFDDRMPPIICGSIEEMDVVLDQLSSNADPAHPLSVAICILGAEINTGLGADPTFVHIQIDGDDESYVAVGEETEGDSKTFCGAGEDSYWKPKNLIPLSSARAAVRHFAGCLERIPAIRWQNREGEDV